ncbi:hypothetical protein F2Q68_00026169 [Brassica cretica]|uniref:Uncharacterized protein n=1 Tax=Brassica cretica TaxID=69181 RepID=A0A8S9IJ93_BRACR|nr:hypothetical protein F2Q68_00026169 [Brassica cretica]
MLSARNSKYPELKPKSQNPKPSRDPTNPNHPIASFVPAQVSDQLQPDPRRTQPQLPSRTARVLGQQASRSHQTIKPLAIRQQTARVPDQPLATPASIRSQSACVQASSRFILCWSGFNNQLS